MTHASFNAGLVGRAARKALDRGINVIDDRHRERLGQLIDLSVDLDAQQGPDVTIDLSLGDHKLLHGHWPVAGK